MAGGYGNIKPEEGKQFSSEYQPKEKWTEEKALKLGEDLIEYCWLRRNVKLIIRDYLIYLFSFLTFSSNIHSLKHMPPRGVLKQTRYTALMLLIIF